MVKQILEQGDMAHGIRPLFLRCFNARPDAPPTLVGDSGKATRIRHRRPGRPRLAEAVTTA